MQLSKTIAAVALAAALTLPMPARAEGGTFLEIRDPETKQYYFYATFDTIYGTSQGRLGETLTSYSRWDNSPCTHGEVGPVTIYEASSNLYLSSDTMSSATICPLELGADGALYHDPDKTDYQTIGIHESSGIGEGTITSDGYYAFLPNITTGLGNDGLLIVHVGGSGGTPIPETFAGFTDVKASDYYATAVQWAVNAGITSGTSATTFSPDLLCTRGQVVTFLWRQHGMPSVSIDNPFQDIKEEDYFYQAALWAYSEGITSGTSATAFSPDRTCTRGEIVTFLWHAAGKPQATSSASFADVAEGSYCYEAVRWAAQEGIASGSDKGNFDPNGVANRAQTVTFLFRA